MTRLTGRVIGGHYKIIKLLGSGTFGKTYLAEDSHQLDSQVAIKQLSFFSNDPEELEQALAWFKREAETLKKLHRHNSIPDLLAYFEENQEFYLVEEFIEGHPLSQELRPGTTLKEDQVATILKEVLKIIRFLHKQAIIHRDIKPANIMRREEGQLVLIDFGTAVVDPLVQRQRTQIGTPGYAPREQMQGNPQFNSDIYALGMTAIQALTGEDPQSLIDPDAPDGIIVVWRNKAEVSDRLAGILDKMVRYDFRERYQSAKEVLLELQADTAPTQKVAPSNPVSQESDSDLTGFQSFFAILLSSLLFLLGGIILSYYVRSQNEIRKIEPEQRQSSSAPILIHNIQNLTEAIAPARSAVQSPMPM